MLSANNYLNLTTHPKVVQASIDATRKYGAGSGSRLVDEDGYANSLGGSPTPVTAFEPPLSPFSPDERRSCPVYPDTRLEIRPSLRASDSINMEEIEMTGNDSD